jgi:GT2 family glycosyltransferase
MSIAGRRHIERHFSWREIATGVEQTLREVVESHVNGAATVTRTREVVELPLVSIGMPVHNASRYLRNALDSLLAQDYANFEIVISDNASTDATEQICREYAEHDRRVLYHKVEQNMGAIWNFNNVFELAKGKYFMWAAYDDIRNPRCVSACVKALEAHPRCAARSSTSSMRRASRWSRRAGRTRSARPEPRGAIA